MKILVTDTGGYISTVLVDELLKRAHQVITLVRFFLRPDLKGKG